MDADDLRRRFRHIGIWRRGGERAPHKPLLLLYALARIRAGGQRRMPYQEVDAKLETLLREFGPARRSYHPELPFWYLKNDGMWELTADADLHQHLTASGHTSRRTLLELHAAGGLTSVVFDRLAADPALLQEVASDLLNAHFPTTVHEDLLSAIGLELVVVKAVRDAQFRYNVLLAYEFRCAVCGFDARLTDAIVGLEAAHVKWHQAGGPAIVPNGIALCSLHHKLFDRGAFTLTTENRLIVSQHLNGGPATRDLVHRFHDDLIQAPADPALRPRVDFIGWHRIQVFRAPGRWTQN